MSIPVEETLHHYRGQATDREIGNAMAGHPPEHLAAAHLLAQSWMAIEASVVGGLMHGVLAAWFFSDKGVYPKKRSPRQDTGAIFFHPFLCRVLRWRPN